MKLCLHTALMALTLSVAAQAAGSKGKELFDKTCRQCHGPEGKGDRIADGFYQLTIPRLNSDYVQKKSDEELGEIVMQGRRKMPPVQMGRPRIQHKQRFGADQLTDLIAYVRTLKKE